MDGALNVLTKDEEQTRPWRFWVRPGRTSTWWDNFTAQVGCYRFQIMCAYPYGRAKTIRKRYRVGGNIFENEEIYLRFQTKTGACGQGLIIYSLILYLLSTLI